MADGNSFNGTLYIRKAPTFRYEDGTFFICHDTGKIRVELAMPPRTFFRAMSAAQAAVNAFHEEKERGGSNVHPMGDKRA